MKSVRFVAALLYYPARILAWFILLTAAYIIIIMGLHAIDATISLPLRIENDRFEIMFPFTNNVFLLGDYTTTYFISNIINIFFYGLFMWLLSNVFKVFKQTKLFTRNGAIQLSRFYISNLVFPAIFILLVLIAKENIAAVTQVILLHLVIGL